MKKRIFIAILAVIVMIGAVLIFIYRYKILLYSSETIVRKALPPYIKVDNIRFDFKDNVIIFGGFKISNPYRSTHTYILEVGEISCRYRIKKGGLLEGFEILDPICKDPTLTIERFSDGTTNLKEAQKLFEVNAPKTEDSKKEKISPERSKGMKFPNIIRLPETFVINRGKFVFNDRLNAAKPNMIALEDISGKISLRFKDSSSKLSDVTFKGEGNINGKKDQTLKWHIVLTPNAPRLTMSNRFEVSNIDLVPFEPYYDKYSPFIFITGAFSGVLIFDFDNGRIGSSNEVCLRNLTFSIKPGFENAIFWETTVPVLAKYFTSPSGDIVFDFKMKGEMSNPEFHLGPISKQAFISMAIDKLPDVISSITESQAAGPGMGESKTDIEKVKDYMGVFKELIKKK